MQEEVYNEGNSFLSFKIFTGDDFFNHFLQLDSQYWVIIHRYSVMNRILSLPYALVIVFGSCFAGLFLFKLRLKLKVEPCLSALVCIDKKDECRHFLIVFGIFINHEWAGKAQIVALEFDGLFKDIRLKVDITDAIAPVFSFLISGSSISSSGSI